MGIISNISQWELAIETISSRIQFLMNKPLERPSNPLYFQLRMKETMGLTWSYAISDAIRSVLIITKSLLYEQNDFAITFQAFLIHSTLLLEVRLKTKKLYFFTRFLRRSLILHISIKRLNKAE